PYPDVGGAGGVGGWGGRQLAYKCRWYGRNYIEIDRWFPSSKRCSNCFKG
ncbi:MAG: transposase, partial [Microcystis aeruginosa F13-15]|nr:transposase [Microcystis aeruginosa F13-15]